jgi:hypothetical protein
MEAANTSEAESSGRTFSSMQSTSSSQSSNRGSSSSKTAAQAHSSGSSTSTTEGYTVTTSRAEGVSEGLEPVFADLPSAVHSFENVLYIAAQTLRSLPAGHAFMHFVDAEGMKSARVQVPLVAQIAVSADRFARLRERIFEKSAFAVRTPEAVRVIAEREEVLFREAQHQRDQVHELTEPSSFRVAATGGNAGSIAGFTGQPKKGGVPAVKGGRTAVAKGEPDP